MDEPRIRIDVDAHKVWLDGQPVRLTSKEFGILAYLASRRGRTVSQRELLQKVWQIDTIYDTKTVSQHVMTLRKALGDGRRFIATVRGVGFLFDGQAQIEGGEGMLPGRVAADVRQLCEQARAGVAAGWASAEVGAFANTVLGVLAAADD